MKKSLGTILFVVALLAMLMLMVVRKSYLGLLVVLALAALYFVLTVISEWFKIHGEKVQNRNRHP